MMFGLFESRLNKVGESLVDFKQSCLLNANSSLLTLQSDRKGRRIQKSLLPDDGSNHLVIDLMIVDWLKADEFTDSEQL